MRRVTVHNKFHGSRYTFRVSGLPVKLSPRQVYSCRKALCGAKDCFCGGALKERGGECYRGVFSESIGIDSAPDGSVWLIEYRVGP